jgi:toxin ParE1/3/4
VKLEWSAFALADRDEIFDYILTDSPHAAVAVDELISAKLELLKRHPEAGRPGRIEGTREIIISGTPYLAAYRVFDDRVRVLRILHGARAWPDDMPD